MWSGGCPTPPRRRSQAFSASQRFQHVRVPRPCFMPQPSVGALPSELSPRSDRAPVPGPLAPLQSSTDARRRAARDVRPVVSPTPALSRSRLVPLPAPDALSSAVSRCFPVAPDLTPREPSPPVSFTYSEAFFPLRIRSRRRELPPAAGRCSPGLLPLQRPFRASDPRPARASRLARRLVPPPRPEGRCVFASRATLGTSSPVSQVNPSC
jgi:hypothetical protein